MKINPCPFVPMHNLSRTASTALCQGFLLNANLQPFSSAFQRSPQPSAFTVISRQSPFHYHFTNFPLMWDNNTSYYLPGDLQEAIHDKYRFFFLDSKGRKYVKRSYLNAKTQSSDISHDYFSCDDVAFFVGKLLLCYRFTRNVFCFLTLKNVL